MPGIRAVFILLLLIGTVVQVSSQDSCQVQINVMSKTDVFCAGQETGMVVAEASSGDPPFTYSIDGINFQSSGTFINLAGGIYQIIGLDESGCADTLSFEILILTQITGHILSQTEIACFGDSTATVVLEGNNGNEPYHFSEDGINFQLGNTFTQLPSNTYNFLIRDDLGCLVELPLIIAQPDSIEILNTLADSVVCNGGNDGSVSFSAIGGTMPYSYLLDGITNSAMPSFSGLISGTHIIRVIDQNGCFTDDQVVIEEPVALILNQLNASSPTCFSGNDASVEVGASGGIPPYTYSIDGSLWQASGVFSTNGGAHLLQVKDANNCVSGINTNINQPDDVGADIVVSDATCSATTDGSVVLSGTGGSGPYTYSLNGGSFQNSGNFSGLGPGTYAVNVLDALGCANLAWLSFDVGDATDLAIDNINITPAVCGGSAGTITVTGSGGNTPYNYSIDGGTTWQPGNFFGSQTSGNYQVVLRDANLCTTAIHTITIDDETTLNFVVDSIDGVSCAGNADGLVYLSGVGGSPVYTFSIDGGMSWVNPGEFELLAEQTYTLMIQDGNGCISDTLISIADSSDLALSVVDQSLEICVGSPTGFVQLIGVDGTPPYTYSDDDVSYGPGDTFVGLLPGSQVFYVKDINGCVKDLNVLIDQFAPPVLNKNIIHPSCPGNSNGQILVLANGVAPIQYSFEGGFFTSNLVYPGLSAGTYTITVSDGNGCFTDFPLTLIDPSPVTIALDQLINVTCFGAADGSISVIAGGGATPYQYSIDGGTNWGPSPLFSPLNVGSYTIDLKDKKGCLTSLPNQIITQPTALNLVAAVTNVACPDDSTGQVVLSESSGPGVYQFSIDGINYQNLGTFNGLPAGNYTGYLKNGAGCNTSTSFIISPIDPLEASWGTIVQPLCQGNENGSLIINVNSGAGSYSYSLNGGISQAVGVFNGLSEGAQLVEVTDASGCTIQIDTILDFDQAVVLSTDSTKNIFCAIDSSGVIWFNASGGTPSYNFFIDGAALPTDSVDNLSAGTYLNWVVDAQGCTDTLEVILTQESLMEGGIISQQNVICNNGSTGNVVVSGTQGVVPYLYSIDGINYNNTNTFTGLLPGNYTIYVQDATLCVDIVPVTIEILNTIQINVLSVQDVLCYAESNGEVTLTGFQGVTPFLYSEDNINFSPNPIISGLTAGNHIFYVKDDNNCTDTIGVFVNQPDSIMLSIDSLITPLCFQGSDGIISISSVGGINPYSFSITPLDTSNSDGLFIDLPSGNYTISLIDQNGCLADSVIQLSQPDSLWAGVTEISEIQCFNQNDAVIEINPSGGTADYVYSFNGSAFGVDSVFPGLAAGTYPYLVKDNNDCLFSSEYTVVQPDSLGFQSVQSTDVLCFGNADGTISSIGTGGTPGYLFALDNGDTNLTGLFNGLLANSYVLSIIDTNACIFTQNISIGAPQPLMVDSLSAENILCNVNGTGSVFIIADGGISDYSYILANIDTNSSGVFENINLGWYSVAIQDANGCLLQSDSIEVSQEDTLFTEVFQIENLKCNNDSSGIIVMGASGGVAPYSFGLSPTALGSDTILSGLVAGNHLIFARDSFQCLDSMLVNVTEPDILYFNALVQNVNCNTDATGSININPLGGTPSYLFSMDSLVWSVNPVFDTLDAGQYSIYITDANNCAKDSLVSIVQPDSLSLILEPDEVTCNGGSNGQILVIASGGTFPYIAVLQEDTLVGNNLLFSDLPANNYMVFVVDSNNCTSLQSFLIEEPDSLVAEIAPVQLTCFGDQNGIGVVNAAGGSGSYNYQWNNLTDDQSYITQPNLIAGITYSVIISDSIDDNCFIINEVIPVQPPPILFDIVPMSLSCNPNDRAVLIEVSSGGVFPFLYQVNNTPPTDVSFFYDLDAIPAQFTVIDSAGCDFHQDFIPFNPNLTEAFFEVDQVNLSVADPLTELTDLSFNRDSLNWDFGDGTAVSGSINTFVSETHTTGPISSPEHEYQGAGVFVTRLTVSSTFGCTDFYEVTVSVSEDNQVYIPNSFTPNGDGINDVFLVQGQTVEESGFLLQIFDRTNRLIFQTTNLHTGWDGQRRDGGTALVGAYVYTVSLSSGGERITKTGSITLIR